MSFIPTTIRERGHVISVAANGTIRLDGDLLEIVLSEDGGRMPVVCSRKGPSVTYRPSNGGLS